jgi:hypothetical protein
MRNPLVRPFLVLCLSAIIAAGCDVNPDDPAQIPIIEVRTEGAVQFHWTPEGAAEISVYRGSVATEPYSEQHVWRLIADGNANIIRSPITYGIATTGSTANRGPVALVPGETYLVEIRREDPKGSGDGFTNTRNRYVGTKSFVAPTVGD